MTYAQAAATYQRNAILTASPEKLVKLLYDGAIKNLEKSRVGLADAAAAVPARGHAGLACEGRWHTGLPRNTPLGLPSA